MSNKKIIVVEGIEIRLIAEKDGDYFSLTDIARRANSRTEIVIQNWMRTRGTVNFLAVWEKLNNPHFNHIEFDVIKMQTGSNAFVLSVVEWAERTKATGIYAKAGRYGGTYAHKDIALEFMSWLDSAFKLYVIREFDRLKFEESNRLGNEWNLRRLLSKVNYHIQTDTIKKHLIPVRLQNTRLESIVYASEADLINHAIFGMNAREWRQVYPDIKGNQRDHASAEQLLVLANLESMNAEFIRQGMNQADRLKRLNDIAIYQLEILVNLPILQQLSDGDIKNNGVI